MKALSAALGGGSRSPAASWEDGALDSAHSTGQATVICWQLYALGMGVVQCGRGRRRVKRRRSEEECSRLLDKRLGKTAGPVPTFCF